MPRFALRTLTLNQSWQMAPLYKEIVARGHHADMFTTVDNISAIVPLNLENIPWEPVESYNGVPYDVIIESAPELSGYALAPHGFSIGFYCGGFGDWLATSDSLPNIARHNLWIGHHEFEQEARRKQGCGIPFPVYGMPSLSNYPNYTPAAKPLRKGLYFNGCPFDPENKRRFYQFLKEFARNNPQLHIHLKNRFFGKDEGSHYSAEPLNTDPYLLLHDGNVSSVQLVKEADFLFGLSTTAFIEALFIHKPVFIVDDFDIEYHYGYRASEIFWYCEPGFTHATSATLAEQLHHPKHLDETLYRRIFPSHDPCRLIIDAAEKVIEAANGRPLDRVILNIDPLDPAALREFFIRYDSDYQRLTEERNDAIFLLTCNKEILNRIRYIVPYLPEEKYQEFTNQLAAAYENKRKDTNWQAAILNGIGGIFYTYLRTSGGIAPEWLSPPQSLYEKQAANYIKEARALNIL